MTNPTPHGQVPEALIDLIDTYADRCGSIYNARTEAARNAVIEALSGVQALSAAPEAIAKLRHLYQNMVNGAVRDTASAKRIAEGLLAPAIEALERATPPAEQQAAPKAAPQQEAQEPVATLHCNDVGYVWARATEVGKLMRFEQPLNLYTAPQPAPAPLSESIDQVERALAIIGVVGAIDGHDVVRRESVLEIARRAALAAQGGK